MAEKSFEDMTIPELQEQVVHWHDEVKNAPGFPSAYAADGFRRGAKAWLARREKEARENGGQDHG